MHFGFGHDDVIEANFNSNMPSRVYQTLEISRMIVLTVQTGIWLPTFGYQAYIKRIVLPASELVHFDRRCANGISTWRKIIDVWRKQGAMRLAQVLVNGVGSRRGSGQRCFARLISH